MKVVLYFDLRPLRSTLSKAFWASFNTESLNVVWQNDRRVLLFRLIWEPLFLNKTKKNIMSGLHVGDSTTIYWKTSLSMSYRGSISSIFSSNSEAQNYWKILMKCSSLVIVVIESGLPTPLNDWNNDFLNSKAKLQIQYLTGRPKLQSDFRSQSIAIKQLFKSPHNAPDMRPFPLNKLVFLSSYLFVNIVCM